MFLNSLYIDGFGPFRDALIGDFKPGFNLVVTKDEQSARALRAFIWSVLFGFGTAESAENNGTYGGFLDFESDEGPVTVSRYSRMGSVDLSGEGGLVTVTGADRNLEKLVGTGNSQLLGSVCSIDPADVERCRDVVKFQITQTVAEATRLAAEEESAARQAAGFPDRPRSIYEIMEEIGAGRSLQLVRVNNLQRPVHAGPDAGTIGVWSCTSFATVKQRSATIIFIPTTPASPHWAKDRQMPRAMRSATLESRRSSPVTSSGQKSPELARLSSRG